MKRAERDIEEILMAVQTTGLTENITGALAITSGSRSEVVLILIQHLVSSAFLKL